ncbi:Lsr2 family protein [Phycicoccus sp. M110.8]|uniref:histone-like nucleoid-structuring protein Lsr2 n=1 Tax=Phycicoccus sp. M110.8 TaxID=3075433 RepID=UPI0028FDBAE1|nr:Lsr2 family protein [Phycicoccus sp. M110.8]MDU0314211.1 Lsr2 family protein [Phycicoccus sp. M110.8]HET8769131.1 Lsr2 family protein [Pedococcus sp.]
MAQRVNIVLEDDLDGSEADETVSFALDGTTYEIDLSAANAAKLRDALAPYVGHARRASGRRAPARSTSGRSAGAKRDLADVREWARANGHQVSDRGRISAEIQAAYDKAH